MINKVILLGNLGQDPEFQKLESCTEVCRVSLATNKSFKDKSGEWQKTVQWHNVIFWKESAIRAQKSLKKGHQIYIEGELNYRKVVKDDETRFYTDIVARSFKRLTKVDASNDVIPPEQPTTAVISEKPAPSSDDDLPF